MTMLKKVFASLLALVMLLTLSAAVAEDNSCLLYTSGKLLFPGRIEMIGELLHLHPAEALALRRCLPQLAALLFSVVTESRVPVSYTHLTASASSI